MMKTPWSHRIIWALDCLFFGFLLDLVLPMPQVSYLSALALFLAGFLGLNHIERVIQRSKSDRDSIALVLTISLVLLFFGECVLIAFGIVGTSR